jgi:hypothetical protein
MQDGELKAVLGILQNLWNKEYEVSVFDACCARNIYMMSIVMPYKAAVLIMHKHAAGHLGSAVRACMAADGRGASLGTGSAHQAAHAGYNL